MDVHVLSLIKKAQTAEHDLTADNGYLRYYKYCTARIRCLDLCLRQPQRKFEHGTVDVDKNYLLILLFSAERAWSHALAIKQAGTTCSHQRYITQLAKAVKCADLFSCSCAHTANPQTALEATAYAAYMKGFYLMDGKHRWNVARENLRTAKAIYKTLASVESADQEIFRRIVEDEIDPSILHCTNKMGMDGSTSVPDEVSPTAQLEAAVTGSSSQQATENAGFLNWLDHKFALEDAWTRSCIQEGKYLEAKLDASTPLQKELTDRRKILGAYQDARRHIREDLMSPDMPEASTEKNGLLDLDRAVSCMILQQAVKRKELLVSVMKSCLCKIPSNHRENAQEQKLVGLYDSLLETLTELYQLITSGSDCSTTEVAYASQLAFNKLYFQAHRCLCLAQAHCRVAEYTQAHMLYQRAQEYVDAAFSNLPREQQVCPEDQHGAAQLEGILMELKKLSDECRSQCCLVYALGVSKAPREEDLLQHSFAEMSLNPTTKKLEKTANLSERADTMYVPGAVSPHNGELPCNLQPPVVLHQAGPCRPFFLDTLMGNAST